MQIVAYVHESFAVGSRLVYESPDQPLGSLVRYLCAEVMEHQRPDAASRLAMTERNGMELQLLRKHLHRQGIRVPRDDNATRDGVCNYLTHGWQASAGGASAIWIWCELGLA